MVQFKVAYHKVLMLGLLGSLFSAIAIWLPLYSFPFIPLLPVFDIESFVPHLALFAALCVLAVMYMLKPGKVVAMIMILCLGLGWATNLNSLRPDFYHYGIMLFIGLWVSVKSIQYKNAARLIHAAVYLWGGVLKINPRFFWASPFHDTFINEVLPPTVFKLFLALVIAVEILIALMFLFGVKRKWAFVISILLHLSIVVQLITSGWNESMIAYNIFLIVGNYVLFVREEAPSALNALLPVAKLDAVKFAALVYLCLPVLNFFNLWPHYMSGSLYSCRPKFAVIYMMGEDKKKLPLKAQKFIRVSGNHEYLDIIRWMESETGGVPNPQGFVYRRIHKKVSAYYAADNKLSLYMY